MMCSRLFWSGASKIKCQKRSGPPRKIILIGTQESPSEMFHYLTFLFFAGTSGTLLFGLTGSYSSGQFFSLGNMPVTLDFHAECCTSDAGFRIYFYIGESSPGNTRLTEACKLYQLFDFLTRDIFYLVNVVGKSRVGGRGSIEVGVKGWYGSRVYCVISLNKCVWVKG